MDAGSLVPETEMRFRFESHTVLHYNLVHVGDVWLCFEVFSLHVYAMRESEVLTDGIIVVAYLVSCICNIILQSTIKN